MRTTTNAKLAVVMCLGGLLGACGEVSSEAKKVQEKSGETWDAMKAWGVAQRDQFMSKAAPMLDTMKQKVSGATGDMAKSLQTDWKGVEQKYEEMKGATGEKWDAARDAFLKAYGELSKKLGK